MPTSRGTAALSSAKDYQDKIVGFLRDMIAIPAESGQEEADAASARQSTRPSGSTRPIFDGLGTVVARIGNGPIKILMDGHIDCVGRR